MNIASIVKDSFRDASRSLVMGTSAATLAQARRRVFVKALSERLASAFADEHVRVFSEFGRGNRGDFGAETLLYDVSVCRVEAGSTAARQSEDFLYVSEALWQIEVDFSRDWRSAVAAVNRLNSGAAGGKLLVAAEAGRRTESFIGTLAAPFASGTGERHLALIPHPADWDESEAAPGIWRMEDAAWVKLSAGD